MAAPEKLKKFKQELACVGIGCPLRFSCKLFFNMNEKSSAREVIKAPFLTQDGQFKGCKLYSKI